MNNINKTLYIPLYGKSYVSKKGIILQDKKAESIWETEGFKMYRLYEYSKNKPLLHSISLYLKYKKDIL